MGLCLVRVLARHIIIILLTELEYSHLLVSRPSKSRALECFVSEIVGKSTHVAMLVCTSTAHRNISV